MRNEPERTGRRSPVTADAPAPDLDRAHDPGVEAARRRAERIDRPGPHDAGPITLGGSTVRVGTAGWTDPTLTAPGVFYPPGATSAEGRLRHYASRFPLVEVDSGYYALPTRRMAALWAERTPDDFVFDVKAHALMTGHPTETARLPAILREALPADAAGKRRVYPRDLPPEVLDAVWAIFLDALEPLRAAGKLGAVLLQYPRWFTPTRGHADEIVAAGRRLGAVPAAIEFRNHAWFSGRLADRTLGLLSEHDLPFVMVDEPQGMASSVPPVVAATSRRLAVLRMHGRRQATWEKRGATVAEKYRYLYTPAELAEWAPRVAEVAASAREVHVVFNNCYANYGTTNAAEMRGMLGERAGN